MNKNDCLNIIKGHKLLKVEKTITNNVITLLIQLGDKIMKQSQFDILFNMLNELKRDNILLNNKIDSGLKEVHNEIKNIKQDVGELKQDVGQLKQDVSELKSDMKEAKQDIADIKRIVTIHDHAMVEHGWFYKANIK